VELVESGHVGENIKAIREITDLPIVGINKAKGSESLSEDKVYITPNFEAAAE
jgi:putative N-acetylmannosamine-6-phosphate epimerase